MNCDCGQCVYATAVWNGPEGQLICVNLPGHEGQLSQVSGGAVTDCRRFWRRRERPAVDVALRPTHETAVREPPWHGLRPCRGGHDIPDESVRYISLGRGRAAIVDAADFTWLNTHKWHASPGCDGYACSSIGGKHVFMHRLIMNPPAGLVVDHINGNKQDNRRDNLRVCTAAQNARNKRKLGGTSRFKGVFWDARSGKWVAAISCRGKKIHLGRFDNEVEAAQAYDRMAIRLFSEFAHLNFPQKIRIVSLSGRICVHSRVSAYLHTVAVSHRLVGAGPRTCPNN
jgi:hypothetical protein